MDELSRRVLSSRASTQTDSTSVILDVSRVTPAVAAAALDVLGVTDQRIGTELAPQDGTFEHRCRTTAMTLGEDDPVAVAEFAALMGTIIHECRHVHDLRSTRIGGELLLHDLSVYAGAGRLLRRLHEWQTETGQAVPIPLSGELNLFTGPFQDIADTVERALQRRSEVGAIWRARTAAPIAPGFSLRDLYEFCAVNVQLDWTAATFGRDVAQVVAQPLLAEPALQQMYLRPMRVFDTLTSRYGSNYEMNTEDPGELVFAALNANGLDDAFGAGGPTDRHPGTWFAEFLDLLARATATEQPPRVSALAAETVLEAAGVPGPADRRQAGSDSLDELQHQVLRSLLRPGDPNFADNEPALIASEVAIDFRAMTVLVQNHPQYHHGAGYAAMLMRGDLVSVHVRVVGRGEASLHLRTPSSIPANHLGGPALASEASQQTRLLLDGIPVIPEAFASEALEGIRTGTDKRPGLRLRYSSVAPR